MPKLGSQSTTVLAVEDSSLLATLPQVGELPTSRNPSVVDFPSGMRLYDDWEIQMRPSPSPLVEGFLPDGSLGVIYGEPGTGKTFLVLDLAFSIATGLDWFGRAVRRGTVAYVAAEGSGGLQARIAAWETAHGVQRGTAENPGRVGLHFLPYPLDLSDKDAAAELTSVLASLPDRPVLVVFDTLARSMGIGDENSSQAMGGLIRAADRIRAELGAAVLFVHHPTKKDRREERGSGQLRGAADVMAVLVRTGGHELLLSCEKVKEYPPFEPLRFVLALCGDSCVVVPLAAAGSKSVESGAKSLLSKRESQAFTVLAGSAQQKLRSSEWKAACKAAGVNHSTFYNVVAKLIDKGLVEPYNEGKHVWYMLSDFGLSHAADWSNGPTM